jgi:hypothetical protein
MPCLNQSVMDLTYIEFAIKFVGIFNPTYITVIELGSAHRVDLLIGQMIEGVWPGHDRPGEQADFGVILHDVEAFVMLDQAMSCGKLSEIEVAAPRIGLKRGCHAASVSFPASSKESNSRRFASAKEMTR